MKKILIFNGSPRKRGNTSILTEHLQKHLSVKIETEAVFLYDYEIKPCLDCRACKKKDLVCTVKDGMHELYCKIEQADALIFGTPIYWFGPTGKTKLLLDRFRPFYGNKKLKGKEMALILPAGSGQGDCTLTMEMFRRVSDALGMKLIETVTSESYDAGDAYNDKEALSNIETLATKLI